MTPSYLPRKAQVFARLADPEKARHPEEDGQPEEAATDDARRRRQEGYAELSGDEPVPQPGPQILGGLGDFIPGMDYQPGSGGD